MEDWLTAGHISLDQLDVLSALHSLPDTNEWRHGIGYWLHYSLGAQLLLSRSCGPDSREFDGAHRARNVAFHPNFMDHTQYHVIFPAAGGHAAVLPIVGHLSKRLCVTADLLLQHGLLAVLQHRRGLQSHLLRHKGEAHA